MASKLEQIKAPIASHINEFEKYFRTSMKSQVSLLNVITAYILKRKGKQMRPMFVFLSAQVCGEISQSTYHAAALIELLHTATLIHDDVVDDSNERRGFFSLNALWKNKISVLIGDYLLSRGLLLSIEHNEFQLLKIVSNATREMSEGELLQIEKAKKLDIKESVYFEIIRKKTASLLAACCSAGAESAKVDEAVVKNMHQFGEYVGIAFQIKDDLFDYEQNIDIGKPTGIDIKEKKMTLPLIYTLENASWADKRKLMNIVRRHNDNPKRVAELIRMVNQSGGIDYAISKMTEYQNNALAILEKFPKTEARDALEQLVLYSTQRKH